MPLRLTLDAQPRWIEIGSGAALLAEPPTTLRVYAARAEAATLFADLLEGAAAVTRAGGRISGLPDVSSPKAAQACQDALFAVCLAEAAVIDWRGVLGPGDLAMPFDPAHMANLMSQAPVADRFLAGYLHPLEQVVTEGNG